MIARPFTDPERLYLDLLRAAAGPQATRLAAQTLVVALWGALFGWWAS